MFTLFILYYLKPTNTVLGVAIADICSHWSSEQAKHFGDKFSSASALRLFYLVLANIG